MKYFLTILFCLIFGNLNSNTISEKIVVVQFNAKWNKHNTVNLYELKNCDVQFAWLKDQPESIKNKIKTVPTIIIYKNKNEIWRKNADLMFKLDIEINEIQNIIDRKLNE